MTFTLLDGGVGQELHRRLGGPSGALWGARALDERPDLVEAVHREFLIAGADVITLASYAATPARLERAGMGDAFLHLHRRAVDAAERARRAQAPTAHLAGCLPPLTASFRPDDAPPGREARDQWARIVDAQSDGVDLFLCETLSSAAEARRAAETASASGFETWTAFTVDETDGTRLRSGEPLLEGADAARRAGASKVLVNCSPPEAASVALHTLIDAGYATGAYANGFETVDPMAAGATVDALKVRRNLDPVAYADIAVGWVKAGAQVVGGCCEISPAHIAEIADRRG